jgi:hypothetical protein
MHSKRIIIYCFIAVGVLLAFIPAGISFQGELDTIPGLIIFTLINLLPLGILIFIIPPQDKATIRQLNGLLWAGAMFLLAHIVFNMAILYELTKKEPGFSTTVIAYLLLPVITTIMMIISYIIGFLSMRK